MQKEKEPISGYLSGISAFLIWGLLPIYWRLLDAIPATTLLAHRIVWSLFFTLILVAIKGDWKWIREAIKHKETRLRYTSAAFLLGGNWWLYIWAVNNNYVLETSLGYYMTPLLSVVFGAIFLKERPRAIQWLSVGFAALGVIYLTYCYGQIPIIGTILGVTFAMYSVMKKNGKLNALQSMTYESSVLFPAALIYLIFLQFNGKGVFGHYGWEIVVLVIMTGIVTQIPMLLFTAAVRPLSVIALGIVSYISPTTTFILSIVYFKESFSQSDLIGFLFIWTGLIIFTIEGLIKHTLKRRRPPL